MKLKLDQKNLTIKFILSEAQELYDSEILSFTNIGGLLSFEVLLADVDKLMIDKKSPNSFRVFVPRGHFCKMLDVIKDKNIPKNSKSDFSYEHDVSFEGQKMSLGIEIDLFSVNEQKT